MKSKYFVFLSLIIFSCSSKDGDLYVIDPRTFVENKITLTDIADDIQYIPLDNSIPLIPYKYIITPKSIYVSAKDTSILRFDRTGKLIQKIGNRGRGPGEFVFGFNFTVDEKSGNVFVMDRMKTLVYSSEGAFLRDIQLEKVGDGMGWRSDIEIFNSMLFYPNTLAQGRAKYCWAILDTLGNPVVLKENPVEPFDGNSDGGGVGIYKFENKMFYYNYFIDTIFSVSPDLSYQPEYLLAQGDFRWPKKSLEYSSINDLNTQIIKIFQFGNMFETKRFLVLVDYFYKKEAAIAFIEKKTWKTYLALKHEKSSDPRNLGNTIACISNDLDGGMPLEDLQYYSEGDQEYITTLIQPFELKLYVASNDFKKSTPKYPEKKKELEQLANSLDENDNPVLMLVKLKE